MVKFCLKIEFSPIPDYGKVGYELTTSQPAASPAARSISRSREPNRRVAMHFRRPWHRHVMLDGFVVAVGSLATTRREQDVPAALQRRCGLG